MRPDYGYKRIVTGEEVGILGKYLFRGLANAMANKYNENGSVEYRVRRKHILSYEVVAYQAKLVPSDET